MNTPTFPTEQRLIVTTVIINAGRIDEAESCENLEATMNH